MGKGNFNSVFLDHICSYSGLSLCCGQGDSNVSGSGAPPGFWHGTDFSEQFTCLKEIMKVSVSDLLLRVSKEI